MLIRRGQLPSLQPLQSQKPAWCENLSLLLANVRIVGVYCTARLLPAVFKGTLNTLGILIMFLHTRQTEYMSTSHLTRIYHLKILRKTESTLLRLIHLYSSWTQRCECMKEICVRKSCKYFYMWIIPLSALKGQDKFLTLTIKKLINKGATIGTKVYNIILFFCSDYW